MGEVGNSSYIAERSKSAAMHLLLERKARFNRATGLLKATSNEIRFRVLV